MSEKEDRMSAVMDAIKAEIAEERKESRPNAKTIAAVRKFMQAAIGAGVEFPDLKVSVFHRELSLTWTVRTTWEEYCRIGGERKARVTFLPGARATPIVLVSTRGDLKADDPAKGRGRGKRDG